MNVFVIFYFFCENALSFGENLSWKPLLLSDFCLALPKYLREDIAYTLYLLSEADYIETHIVEIDGGICEINVYRLTYTGHEFVDTIKSDTIWKKIQKALSSVSSASLPVIQSLGSHYALEILTYL